MAISFPVLIVLLNGFSGGYIESHLSAVWSMVRLLSIADGDIYVGAGGLLLVSIATISVVIQVHLVRFGQND